MTKSEKHLWYDFLRSYPVQFKRQVTIGEYIIDFYCPQAKLTVELDGSYHTFSKISENDKTRSDYLNSNGIFVMRFPNKDVWDDFIKVCNQIDFMVQQRVALVDSLSGDLNDTSERENSNK
jgi:very-short-patch-repair endonuclease